MLYVRMNSWQFHRARALGYRMLYRYQWQGKELVAMQEAT